MYLKNTGNKIIEYQKYENCTYKIPIEHCWGIWNVKHMESE